MNLCACGKEEKERKLVLPSEENWIERTTFDKTSEVAWLKPVWYSREIYDESVVFIGEDASARLLFEPQGSVIVRNYFLDKTYTEGVDYVVEGKTIKRLSGGEMPFWKVDEYFRLQPNNSTVIGVNPAETEYEFTDSRYLYYGEGTEMTSRQVAVSYRTNELYDGFMPKGCYDKTENVLKNIKEKKSGTILFYGDSITVGCNASGTIYGGNVNPYLPSWAQLVANKISSFCNADINVINEAVGGWSAKDGFVSFDKTAGKYSANADIFVIAFGMNDGKTAPDVYKGLIEEMANKYLQKNPDGLVVLVSPMNPNTQSLWVGNQTLFETSLKQIAEERENIIVAEVGGVFRFFEERGKRTRDYLANNINHPNDFGVRVYAQVVLKSILGNNFFTENYA